MTRHESIAVVGLGCRYPDAPSPAALWDTVIGRRQAFRAVPPQRLSQAYIGAADAVDRTYVQHVAVLDGWHFDRQRFHIPAHVYRATDLTHWLSLETAAAALADAGFPHAVNVDHRRVGVIIGNSLTGEFTRTAQLRYRLPFLERILAEALRDAETDDGTAERVRAAVTARILAAFPEPDDETLAGALSNTIAGRVCNYFDFGGGGYTIDGACSSSLLAVVAGCRSLVTGEVDLVVAGGVDLSLDPFELVGFARLGALAHGPMRVFDAEPTGFLPGEGCGLVVLMRAADARAQGIPTYGGLLGWGTSSDGTGGITRPEVDGELRALAAAYSMADVDPEAVSLIEGHGTGTPIGDAVELEALNRLRGRAPAALGSIKANIGHTKAAAGAASLIKTVLAVHRRVLPPTTGVDRPHPLLSPDLSGLTVPDQPATWPVEEARAGVSSMGFGGINCHVVVAGEAAPVRGGLPRYEEGRTGRPGLEILALEAPDLRTMRAMLGAVQDQAPTWSRAELTDVAGTLARTFSGMSAVRCVLVAEDPVTATAAAAEAASRLSGWEPSGRVPLVDQDAGFVVGAGRPARVGLLFPGQAAPVRTRLSSWAADLRTPSLPEDLELRDGATNTAQAQPTIVRQELAALAWLDRAGVEAVGAVGHSLGEIVALTWAGAFDPVSALRLAVHRGQAMATFGVSGTGMLSVRADADALACLLADGQATVACHNGPFQTVVAGPEGDLAAFAVRARAAGFDCTPLPVSHAFHSPAMEPVTKHLEAVLSEVSLGEPRGDVFSTVTGAVLRSDEDVVSLLVRQLVEPVRFAAAVQGLTARCDLLVEVGPGSTLTGLVGEWLDLPVLPCDAGGPERSSALTLAALAAAGAATVQDWRGQRAFRPRSLEQTSDFLTNPCEADPRRSASAATITGPIAVTHPTAPGRGNRTRETATATVVPATGDDDPFGMLRTIIAARVDLSAGALDEDCSPLRDLHVSSLEVRRCVADVCARLGLTTPDPALSLSDASLREIADVIEQQPRADEAGPVSVAGVRPWVAAFEHRWTAWSPSGDGPPAAEPVMQLELEQSDGAAELAGHVRAVVDGSVGGVLIRHRAHPAAAGLGRSFAVEAGRIGVTVLDEAATPWAADPMQLAAPVGEYRELRVTAEGGLERVSTRRRPVQPARPPTLSGDDLLLVTGGASGVTARCAVELAIRDGCGLVVAARSAASDPAVAAAVESLRATGVAVTYEACDITDRAAVADLLAALRQRGTVAGLVHGAAVNVPTPLAAVSSESLRAAWGPKVTGLHHILDLAGDSLRLVVGFGSIIGRFGLAGQLDYAIANDAMRIVLEQWSAEHPECRVRVLEWSVWAELGMGLRMDVLDDLRRQGVEPILPALGVDLFTRIVDEADAPVTTLVTSRIPPTPTAVLVAPASSSDAGDGSGRFLESLPVHVPGAEVVSDTALSYGDDPYLRDHEIGDSAVLPAVMVLEAFAQSAALLGLPPGPVAFEDVALTGLLDVPEDGSTVLRVAALREDTDSEDGGLQVEAVARSGEDGFTSDRVRAILRPGNPSPTRAEVPVPPGLDTEWPSSLYGSVLFHGGRLRRVGRYDLLTAFRVRAWIHADAGSPWFSSFHDRRLRLGDPGALDAALHVLLPAVPQRLALPVGCDRVEVDAPADGWLRVDAEERSRDDDEYVFDVELTTPAGRVVSHWSGLRLRAVDVRQFPEGMPVPLVGPWLTRLALSIGWPDAPELVSAPGERASGDASHLLEELIGAPVQHTPEGRPTAVGEELSASYCGGATLAGRAPVPLGVDWQRLDDLDPAAWRSCLPEPDRVLAARIGEALSEPSTVTLPMVWCAREALRKAIGDDGGPLTWGDEGPLGSVRLDAGTARLLMARNSVREIGRVAYAVALGGAAR
jgi:enediyne polyketide synthase